MTSRQLVKKALEFDTPPRTPRQLWSLPWAEFHHPEQLKKIRAEFPDDIITSPAFYKTPPKTIGDQYALGNYTDEWGCVFQSREPGYIGEVKEPLIKTWADLDKVAAPDELLTVDVEKVNDFCRASDKFIISDVLARPFERIQFLRGSENTYMDIALGSGEFKTLLEKVHNFFVQEILLWAHTDVDALFFMDDWGGQKSLLISPETWRSVFKPLYKEYIDIAHNHGKKIFMHSDGCITDIIGDLVELGLDALNSQVFCMGPENLGGKFRGKLTFWGEIDRQHILPEGSKQEVVDAVELFKRSLGQNGGIIAQCEFGPGAKPENVCTVFEQWNK